MVIYLWHQFQRMIMSINNRRNDMALLSDLLKSSIVIVEERKNKLLYVGDYNWQSGTATESVVPVMSVVGHDLQKLEDTHAIKRELEIMQPGLFDKLIAI